MPVRLIYFSPTATTQKIVRAIAEGFVDEPVIEHDLTRVSDPPAERFQDGIAVIGIPVYAGRVPEICLQRLSGFSAAGVPVVLVVLYGNREY